MARSCSSPTRNNAQINRALAFVAFLPHLWDMSGLTPLDACLAQALHSTTPVPPETLGLREAMGHALAEDLLLPHDLPTGHEALRAGFAVNALDLMGASAALPLPLHDAPALMPGMPLPPGTDAILPEDRTQVTDTGRKAIDSINPGDGVRRAGHDGRKGDAIARAGQPFGTRHQLLARLAGISHVRVRRPRVQVAIDLPLATFVADWARSLGALITDEAPQLVIRPTRTQQPRLALAPGDTGWLARDGEALTLELPPRHDGGVAALLALGLPALAALGSTEPRPVTRPVDRKITSTVGLSELVLLSRAEGYWRPGPAGTLTLTTLARAAAFAIIPPDSEGIGAQTALPGLPLDTVLG